MWYKLRYKLSYDWADLEIDIKLFFNNNNFHIQIFVYKMK